MCCRFEYQLEGERVINALQDANKLPIVTNEIGEAREKVKMSPGLGDSCLFLLNRICWPASFCSLRATDGRSIQCMGLVARAHQISVNTCNDQSSVAKAEQPAMPHIIMKGVYQYVPNIRFSVFLLTIGFGNLSLSGELLEQFRECS